MSIQWFPGHMAKARRHIEERLKLVDVVYELLDARLPQSSRNPMLDEIVQGKPRLVLLTKADLADPQINHAWKQYFQKEGKEVLAIDAKTGKGVGQIPHLSEKQLKPLFAKRAQKGIRSKKIRALVLGIPNVGKSSLINRLARRSATETGDRPGVTKAQQWIRIGKNLELLDTPGILWPKFDDQTVGMRLAVSGAIKEEILPVEEVALYGLEYISQQYPQAIQKRYRLDNESLSPLELLQEIGKKRGCLQKGGEVDHEKAAEIFLTDLRSGRLGPISLETPEDWVEEKRDEKNDT